MSWAPFVGDGPQRDCEAPRHRGQGLPASYLFVLVDFAVEPSTVARQNMCEECMAAIAADLGTTPGLGAVRIGVER